MDISFEDGYSLIGIIVIDMKYDKETKTITLSQNTGVTISLMFLILIGGAIASASTWVSMVNSKVDFLEKVTGDNASNIMGLQADSNASKVKYAEIQTQLKSIDTTLIEIKQAMKEK